jgi:hypothetical protein
MFIFEKLYKTKALIYKCLDIEKTWNLKNVQIPKCCHFEKHKKDSEKKHQKNK